MAQEKLFALLVSGGEESFSHLKTLLKNLDIEAWSARTCDEASQLLDQTHPELIFTGERVFNETWIDVLNLAEKASVPTNVIVVGRYKDIDLYLSTLDCGAFDFILPPFEADPIAHVVRAAAENVRRRREERAMRAAA